MAQLVDAGHVVFKYFGLQSVVSGKFSVQNNVLIFGNLLKFCHCITLYRNRVEYAMLISVATTSTPRTHSYDQVAWKL